MDLRYGDVVEVDLSDTIGSVQGKKRPCVVIQNDMGNMYSPTSIVIPLSSRIKKLSLPTHYLLRKSSNNGLRQDSVVLAEQVRVIDKSMITRVMGHLDDVECDNVVRAFLAILPQNNIRGNYSAI